jgi:outer membrane protein TolC
MTTHDYGRARLRRHAGATLAVLACSAMALSAQSPQQPAGSLSLLDVVRTTLSAQPSITLAQERLAASRGDLQAAQGQFDINVSTAFTDVGTRTPNTEVEQQFQRLPSVSNSNIATMNTGFTKLLKSGQMINPTASLTRTAVTGVDLPSNRAAVSVFFVQPLMRGRDAQAVTAGLRASEAAVASSEADVRFLRSTGAFQSAIAYWNYVAAVRRLDVYRQSEARARLIADQTRILISAGTRPAADLKQVQASLASRISSRIGGEQSVFAARQDLGVAIGLPFEQMALLPPPADDFPDAPASVPDLDGLARLALERRSDLVSARAREVSANAILLSATDAVKPKIDLQASVGYAGLDEGAAIWTYLSPFAVRPTGPNFTVGFAWNVSRENNSALGRLARSRSQLTQSRIETADLSRNIQSGVAVSYDAVRRSVAKLDAAREAAAVYRGAVDDQRDLAQLGVSTILDLINTEDRLTNSLLDELGAEQAYALALTQLRYQTGLLLNDMDDVDITTLTTLPGVPRH